MKKLSIKIEKVAKKRGGAGPHDEENIEGGATTGPGECRVVGPGAAEGYIDES